VVGFGKQVIFEHRQAIRVSCEDLINDLAKHLAAAFLAYQMDISFESAMRNYIEPKDRMNDPWRLAAQFLLDSVSREQSCGRPSEGKLQ
jgi:hypothetical protein